MGIYKPKVTVVGSANIDLVTKTNRVPLLGETILGESFQQFPGGKGANQAVAAARLGADVSFIGCVGNDPFGHDLKRLLAKEQIDITGIDTNFEVSTGVAQITLSNQDNSIIVVPGANHMLSAEWIEKNKPLIVNADIVLLQLEIPLEIVAMVVTIAHESNIPVILNPAPAQKLSADLLSKITYLTPNGSEIELLSPNSEDIISKTLYLQKLGVKNMIVTRGAEGVVYKSEDNPTTSKDSIKVEVVDSTGAGDSFNGALAVAIGAGKSIDEAIDFSIKVAAVSVTKLGAQSGMPYLKELIEY